MEISRLAQTDADEMSDSILVQPDARRTHSTGKLLGTMAASLLVGAWAGSHFGLTPGQSTVVSSSENLQELSQIIAKPERGQCSSWKEDCFSTGCCDIVGYTCYQTKPGIAKCMKNCTASATQLCTQPQSIMEPVLQDASAVGTSLYCFSVYTKDTGTTKKTEELETIQYQFSKGLSIFACEQQDVFADVQVEVGPGLQTIKVVDAENDWHFAKRKETGAWVNTGMFTQVWKAIASGGKTSSADWVVKVDADAVFIPSRLTEKLASQLVPPSGIYLENCKYVEYGYFGNLEVFSKAAWDKLIEKIDECKADSQINWKVGVHQGKYGPMGEDLFAQACLDKFDVRRVEAFDITTDGACPADRPIDEQKNKKWKPTCAWTATSAMHPFKKVKDWAACHDATMDAFGLTLS
jgi:hypothetical protein